MTTPPPTIRVVIAADHPVFLDGLRTLVVDTDGLELVGEASTGDAAVRLCEQARPDVVLLDLRMPGLDGIQTTRRIVEDGTAGAILILTMIDDDSSVFAAIRAGARGYVLKGASGADILQSIRVVASGKAIFGADVAVRMPRYFARPRADPHSTFPQLSAREHEILHLIARGLTNAAIATALILSEKTVRNNVSAILTKLRVSTRAEAIVHAREAGLGQQAQSNG